MPGWKQRRRLLTALAIADVATEIYNAPYCSVAQGLSLSVEIFPIETHPRYGFQSHDGTQIDAAEVPGAIALIESIVQPVRRTTGTVTLPVAGAPGIEVFARIAELGCKEKCSL